MAIRLTEETMEAKADTRKILSIVDKKQGMGIGRSNILDEMNRGRKLLLSNYFSIYCASRLSGQSPHFTKLHWPWK